ncbi:MAG: hypothetical protein K2X67_06930 [Burkholderiales bacterium]|jgi:hypothetical protein|nr:hypothetical protein [Burkholderiales bacterium]
MSAPTLTEQDELFIALGKIVAAWGALEATTKVAAGALGAFPNVRVAWTAFDRTPMSAVVRVARTLAASADMDEALRARYDDLLSRIGGSLLDRRNRAIHDMWLFPGESPLTGDTTPLTHFTRVQITTGKRFALDHLEVTPASLIETGKAIYDAESELIELMNEYSATKGKREQQL